VDFQAGLRDMVVPWLENSAWKYTKVGTQIAAHDFCKWLEGETIPWKKIAVLRSQ